MMNYQPQPYARPRSPKSVFLAVLLQSSPLLTVAGCTQVGLDISDSSGLSSILMLGMIFAWLVWGVGYAYLGRWKRFAAAFLLGPVFVLVSCSASFHGVNYDFEHGRGDPTLYHHAALQQAIVIAIATVFVMVDVARLAILDNFRLAAPGPVQPYFYQPRPDPEMDDLTSVTPPRQF